MLVFLVMPARALALIFRWPTLNLLGHYANYLFPSLMGKRGTLDCNADTLVSAIALRFIGDAFSTLPVILPD